jgi:hypothetical protein
MIFILTNNKPTCSCSKQELNSFSTNDPDLELSFNEPVITSELQNPVEVSSLCTCNKIHNYTMYLDNKSKKPIFQLIKNV